MTTNNETMHRVDMTALTVIGEKQRVAGEDSKRIADKLMEAILAGNIELAEQLLAAIESACDAHKATKGTRFAFTYAAIAACRDTIAILGTHTDAIGGDAWNKYYDILGSQLLRLSSFMPSSVSNGGSDKNVPLSDMLRGLKSVTRAVGRTDLAYIPSGKASDTLTAARKAEQDRLDRKNSNKAETQKLPQPETAQAEAETPEAETAQPQAQGKARGKAHN